MRNNSGVTMMMLAITVVVLFIISTIVVNTGIGSYQAIKIQNFVAKMKTIQARVDQIAEEFTNEEGEFDTESFFRKYSTVRKIEEDDWNNKLDKQITKTRKFEDYYYFEKDDLNNILGLKDIDMRVIINFSKREVISIDGVKYVDENGDVHWYYSQDTIDNNVEKKYN